MALNQQGLQTITFASSLFSSGAKTLLLTQGELSVKKNITITGPGQNLLTIDANQQSRVFDISGLGTHNIIISGMTITNGNVSGSGSDAYGGAVRVSASTYSVTLDSVTIKNSSASLGGGIYVADTTSTSASSASLFTLINSTLSNNEASGGGGAGMYIHCANATIQNSIFSGNTALNSGGGIAMTGGRVVNISETTFSNNTASSGKGGAASLTSDYNNGVLTITSCSFTGNHATEGGGIHISADAYNRSDSVTLINITSSGNTTTTSSKGTTIAKAQGVSMTIKKTSTGQTKIWDASIVKYLEDGQNWFA
ncbi:MAG: hypothetical protein LBJ67_04745 [Planctomycetaceae bacterium]|jgi:predicted outer membrane repeat protein|nr:hypothetical protein [Planctomycetaceae bacterium]